jgi:hypothetical protein
VLPDHLVLDHPNGQWQQLYHLVPPDPATTAADGFGQRLPTLLADLGRDQYDLVHLFDRQ